MRAGFPIRYKFLAVTTLLLIVCVGVYLLLATRSFKEDKTDMVWDYNSSMVSNISSDIETLFKGVTDKMKLVAFFFKHPDKKTQSTIQQLLEQDPSIVYVGGSDRFQKINNDFYVNKSYLETYGLAEAFYTGPLLDQRPIPFQKIQEDGEAIWNATTQLGPPLIGFGRSVIEEDEKGVPIKQYAVIAFIKADKLLNALTRGKLNEVFITNQLGELLAHTDQKLMQADQILVNEKIVETAKSQLVRTSVISSVDQRGDKILGAYSKSFNNRMIVVSKISEKKAFSVVDRLIYRSLIFAGIVVTLAFLAAILFSRSLTRPIQTLVKGMRKVSDGELDTQIKVSTKDEISILANSFNVMIRDLQSSRQELEDINRDLEDKVKERTHQLEKQNQAVKSAQEALLRTTRLAAVGEIAGRAAHEVLNPLTSIMSRIEKVKSRINVEAKSETQVIEDIVNSWDEDYKKGGFNELVKVWGAPSEVRGDGNLWDEDIENIRTVQKKWQGEVQAIENDVNFLLRESQRISRIVQSMRSLSVVKSEKANCSLNKLLQDSVNIMADLASLKDFKISIRNSYPEIQVKVDEDEFIQSTTNLLRNALQAMEANIDQLTTAEDKTVHVDVEVDGEQVAILIKDRGVGITEEHRKKLFESQFSTKSKQEGTGLGLNISRRFIRAFGGDITLHQSEEGQGSVFKLTLPLPEGQSLNKKVSA